MPSDEQKEFITLSLDRMKNAGLRLTKPRKMVVEILELSNIPLSAYRIHEQITASGAQADVVSVYRTLTTLDSLGLVHYVHSADGFMACTVDHHHEPGSEHAVCDDC